ncbi:MAG TPA: M55 family metallopeptidase [Symbiobacteriaceae bacterium]|nr:M55 family metallopeptidase [Symbiobacteriaceae bacterium]
MRIFISCDMEGITGVAIGKHCNPSEPEYQRFRKLMTRDVNAAIEGAASAGATEFLVVDSHGPMTNILIEELDPRAELISGSNKHFCQMEGIDSSFDGAFFLGYHAREGGGDGVINHTVMGVAVTQLRCNGREIGETGLNAGLAGFYGVPVALISGDNVVAEEAREILGDVETAVVKQAINRHTARLLSVHNAQNAIREKAATAVYRMRDKAFQPLVVNGPVTFEIDFKTTDAAHMTTLFPSVKRLNSKTVSITAEDYPSAFKQLWGTLILGAKVMGGVL